MTLAWGLMSVVCSRIGVNGIAFIVVGFIRVVFVGIMPTGIGISDLIFVGLC